VNASPLLRTRRRPRWLGVLAVVVFGFRALIPTGYMLGTVDGHARLILCPAAVHYAGGGATADHGMAMDGAMARDHAGMDAAASMRHADHAAQAAEHCPFALSGGASLSALNQEPAKPYFALLQPPRPPLIHSASSAPPWRYHAPRGPPSPA
jgi:hypothetical protein